MRLGVFVGFVLLVGLVLGASAGDCEERAVITDENIVRVAGEIARMTQQEALDYCKQQGGHLASTREFAQFMNADAILEAEQVVEGKVPEGYYKVSCVDEHGEVDTFHFNNERGRTGQKPRKLTGDLAAHSFWTSSLVLGKTDYAHVFYGPLGGGGGTPEDHHRERRHAVVLIKN